MALSSRITTLQTVFGRKSKVAPPNATAEWRPYAASGTNLSKDDKWRSMKLRTRKMVPDEQGQWWLIEERQCLQTGLKLKRTRRITE